MTCLLGCMGELPAAICIRPAAVPASVLRPPLMISWSRCLWQTTNWLRSRRTRKAFWSGVGVVSMTLHRRHPHRTPESLLGSVVCQNQEPKSGGQPTSSTCDAGRWSSAPCSRTADGLRNSVGDLASFTSRVCVHEMGLVHVLCFLSVSIVPKFDI